MVVGTAVSAATGAASKGIQSGISGAMEPDPEIFLKSYQELLKQQNLTPEEYAAKINRFQATMKSVETLAAEMNGLGLDGLKFRQSMYQDILTSYGVTAKEQASKSSEAYAMLLQELNRKALETEQSKLDAKMNPYRIQGSVAGFMQVAGMLMNVFKPGSGDQILAQSQTMIDGINAKIDALKLEEPDMRAWEAGYGRYRDTIRNINFDSDALYRHQARRTGDSLDEKGMPLSTGTLQGQATDVSKGRIDGQIDASVVRPPSTNVYDVPGGASGAAQPGAAQPPAAPASVYDVPAGGNTQVTDRIQQAIAKRLKEIQAANPALTDPVIDKVAAGYVMSNTDQNFNLTSKEAASFRDVIKNLDVQSQSAIWKVLNLNPADAPSASKGAKPAAPIKPVSFNPKDISMAEDVGAVLAGLTGKPLTSKQVYQLSDEIVKMDANHSGRVDDPTELAALQAKLLADQTISEAQRKAILTSSLVKEPAPN